MVEENGTKLPPISKWWIGLYTFAAFWLLLVASLDSSHFGPGFFPLLISIVLVPLLAIIFAVDLFARVVDAILGKRAALARRLGPVAVAATGAIVYGGISVLFLIEQS
ncbi:MAG: hypothetical protein KJO09_07340 [Gammaproteobacteria bacterium]|nr:hypothetical protein [Gammaproteobacteria bacterium]